jgi:hypothetical protein
MNTTEPNFQVLKRQVIIFLSRSSRDKQKGAHKFSVLSKLQEHTHKACGVGLRECKKSLLTVNQAEYVQGNKQ